MVPCTYFNDIFVLKVGQILLYYTLSLITGFLIICVCLTYQQSMYLTDSIGVTSILVQKAGSII